VNATTYRVETPAGALAVVVGDGPRWTVEGPEAGESTVLCRERAGRFVMESTGVEDDGDGGNRPPASITPLEPLGFPGNLYYLLRGDGSLFRIRRSDPRTPGFHLSSWETDGAYLVAHPEQDGWRVEATPAGEGIDATRELVILFAAVIVDEERFSRSDSPVGGQR